MVKRSAPPAPGGDVSVQVLLRSVSVPVLALERGEDRLVRLRALNDEACSLLSIEAAAVTGLPLYDFLPPGLADELTAATERALSVRADVVLEQTVPGRCLRLTVRSLGQASGGQEMPVRQVLCTVTILRQSEEPEGAALDDGVRRLRLRLLDRIVARGGHSLGNYLQPILTFSRYAMGELPSATRDSYLGYVLEAGEQIQSLIAVTRIVARAGAATTSEWAEVSINHLIEDLEDVGPMLLPLDVSARAVIDAPGAKVDSCRGDLMLVLLNIILDAADSMVRKGEIVLRASRGDYADRLIRPNPEARSCVRIDVESTGARQEARGTEANCDVMLRLIDRCGGGFGFLQSSPEEIQMSIFLPERVDGGVTVAG